MPSIILVNFLKIIFILLFKWNNRQAVAKAKKSRRFKAQRNKKIKNSRILSISTQAEYLVIPFLLKKKILNFL